jgi:hypothetical protein
VAGRDRGGYRLHRAREDLDRVEHGRERLERERQRQVLYQTRHS